jgi:signal transduction histidine kinase
MTPHHGDAADGGRGRWLRPLLVPPEGLERLRTRLAVLGFWLVLAALETVKEWVTWRLRGAPRGWGSVALVNVPFWLYWALATPFVIALAHRFRLDVAPRARAIAAHAAFSLVAALGHVMTVTLIAWLVLARTGELSDPTFAGPFRTLVEGYLVLEMAIYWMVLGAYHALLYHRRYVDGRLREADALTRAARSEAGAAEARLQALRQELDPHFLFNALNAVAGLVRRGDAAGAVTMLSRLGELLRVTLRYGRGGLVSLGREIELVQRYLEIEEVRLGDRLTVVIDVAADARDVSVPPLLLQPLVENAVRHGVAPVPGPARIVLRARVTGGALRVEVEDSGPGPVPGAAEGTGLRNVRDRLEAEYGSDAAVHVELLEPRGARSVVVLPLRTPPAAGAPPPRPVLEVVR